MAYIGKKKCQFIVARKKMNCLRWIYRWWKGCQKISRSAMKDRKSSFKARSWLKALQKLTKARKALSFELAMMLSVGFTMQSWKKLRECKMLKTTKTIKSNKSQKNFFSSPGNSRWENFLSNTDMLGSLQRDLHAPVRNKRFQRLRENKLS